MKKIIFLFAITFSLQQTTMAQATPVPIEPTPFKKVMLKNIGQLDTASSAATLLILANNFERIGNAEKIKWQPFYYAAYCYVAMAFQSSDKAAIDPLADQAETLLQRAENLEKDNSEITTLFAMITSCRILVDPVSRFQTKGKEAQALLAKAKEENASNPRIYLLEARMQLRTPEAFGGGAKPAKQSIETALEKFKSFQPASIIDPVWGLAQAKNVAAQINNSQATIK